MKKVLFVATVVKTHIMQFHIPYLELLKNNGYETHVCARNDYKNKEDCVIPYCDKYYDIPFERSPFDINNIGAYNQLKKIIDSNDYEIIHCHTPVGGVLTRLAAKSVQKNSTRVIYTAHGFHFYKGAPIKNWMFFYPIERLLAKYTDVLITINKEDYNRAKKSFKAKRVEYIPGVGIDIDKFNQVIINKSVKRKELGLPEDSFVVLSVGELNRNKNHETVIKAIKKLSNPKVYFLICGQGPLEDNLKNFIKGLGLEKQVKLLGYRRDIVEISKSADVFTLPSFREGLPVALMEAMASGLPIVCSRIRGNTDLIEDGKGGYLIEATDSKGFADAINEIIQNINLIENMCTYNKGFAMNFDINNVKEAMKKIYFGSDISSD